MAALDSGSDIIGDIGCTQISTAAQRICIFNIRRQCGASPWCGLCFPRSRITTISEKLFIYAHVHISVTCGVRNMDHLLRRTGQAHSSLRPCDTGQNFAIDLAVTISPKTKSSRICVAVTNLISS